MSMDATLSTWALTKKSVNSRQKFFLLSLARRVGDDNTCWPSIKCMVEDTGFDRKTIVDLRQELIKKSLIKYTGRRVGHKNQIPEMKLMYVEPRQIQHNNEGPEALETPVDNSPNLTVDNSGTSTENGTRTSTENGTRTSTENGTRNRSFEKIIRNKSFCADAPKKPKSKSTPKKTKAEWRKENNNRPVWADKKDEAARSKEKMNREKEHIDENEEFKRTPVPPDLKKMINKLKSTMIIS